MSWYPTQVSFNKRRVDYVGRWTDKEEDWLLERQRQILDPTEPKKNQPLSSASWANTTGALAKLDLAYEPLAHDFLQRYESSVQ